MVIYLYLDKAIGIIPSLVTILPILLIRRGVSGVGRLESTPFTLFYLFTFCHLDTYYSKILKNLIASQVVEGTSFYMLNKLHSIVLGVKHKFNLMHHSHVDIKTF
jgi:hypothetical protein